MSPFLGKLPNYHVIYSSKILKIWFFRILFQETEIKSIHARISIGNIVQVNDPTKKLNTAVMFVHWLLFAPVRTHQCRGRFVSWIVCFRGIWNGAKSRDPTLCESRGGSQKGNAKWIFYGILARKLTYKYTNITRHNHGLFILKLGAVRSPQFSVGHGTGSGWYGPSSKTLHL